MSEEASTTDEAEEDGEFYAYNDIPYGDVTVPIPLDWVDKNGFSKVLAFIARFHSEVVVPGLKLRSDTATEDRPYVRAKYSTNFFDEDGMILYLSLKCERLPDLFDEESIDINFDHLRKCGMKQLLIGPKRFDIDFGFASLKVTDAMFVSSLIVTLKNAD